MQATVVSGPAAPPVVQLPPQKKLKKRDRKAKAKLDSKASRHPVPCKAKPAALVDLTSPTSQPKTRSSTPCTPKPTPVLLTLRSALSCAHSQQQQHFTLYSECELPFFKSLVCQSQLLVECDMDDDVQTDGETVANAQYGMLCDVREAVKRYTSKQKKTTVVNLDEEA